MEKTIKQPAQPWTDQQIQIINSRCGEPIKKTQQRLLDIGSNRTIRAIKSKIFKIGSLSIEKEYWYHTPSEICMSMKIDTHTFNAWIKTGILEQNKNGLITDVEVKKMLINYTAMIDFSVIDKYWLVDVLTGESGAKNK